MTKEKQRAFWSHPLNLGHVARYFLESGYFLGEISLELTEKSCEKWEQNFVEASFPLSAILGSATTTHFYGRVGSLYTRPDPTNGRVGRVFGRVFWSFLVAFFDRIFENKQINTLFLITSTVFWC